MSIFHKLPVILIILQFCSCDKFKDYNQVPELESLQQGLKTSAAIAYCSSVVISAAAGQKLPGNVLYDTSTGLIYIKIDDEYPLPFNSNIGDIVVAFTWSGRAGLMSVLFANIDLLDGNIKLYGLHLIPIIRQSQTDEVCAVFTKQDIIIGNGSDTLLNMSNVTDIVFNSKINQLNAEKPENAFVAVKQNVWFINIDQKGTYSDVYDDNITISGGGQIAEASGSSGGVLYHAMIGTKMNYSICDMNPIDGIAFSQNFKFGGEPYIDLGNSLLSFHPTCDGNAYVVVSTGKYMMYNNRYIALNLN